MTSFFWIFEITATFLEQFFLLCLGGLFFERRIKTNMYGAGILLLSLAYTAFVTYLNSLSIYSYATLSIGILLFVLALVSFNKCNVIQACCLSVIYMVIISTFDFLFLIFVEYVLKAHEFVIAVLTGNSPERLITLIIAKVTLALAYLAIKIKRWKIRVSNLTALVLIVFAVFAFLSMQFLVGEFLLSEYAKAQEIILIAFAFMALFFLSVLLVLNGQEKIIRKAKEKERAELELTITKERNQELIETYSKIAKVSHDFKNQMKVTLLMLKNGDVSEAQDYLSGIVDVAAKKSLSYTGVSPIDAVLSEKARVAAENGIKMEMDVSISSLCGVDSMDVCTVLLNLIDNAIEACLKINDEEKRNIRVVLKNANSMILLKTENTLDENGIDASGELGLSTTKKDKTAHGYGVKIVRSIAEEYNGSFVVKNENGSFVVTVLLCK